MSNINGAYIGVLLLTMLVVIIVLLVSPKQKTRLIIQIPMFKVEYEAECESMDDGVVAKNEEDSVN